MSCSSPSSCGPCHRTAESETAASPSDLILTSTLGSQVAPEAAKGSHGCEKRQDQRRIARDPDYREPFPRRVP